MSGNVRKTFNLSIGAATSGFRAVLFIFCLSISTSFAQEGIVWRLGKSDGSPDEFIRYRAWEYGSAPGIAADPAMDVTTHTWRFTVPASGGEVAAPRIPSSICTIHESVFMRDAEVVTGLELSWNEAAHGSRILKVECCGWQHSPDHGRSGVEISLPDGHRRLYDIPDGHASGKKDGFVLEFPLIVSHGENMAAIRIVSTGKHESISFDAISLVESDAQPLYEPILELSPEDPDGLFHPGDNALMAVRLSNANAGTVSYEVRDIATNVVFAGEAVLSKDLHRAIGAVAHVSLPSCRKGWFKVTAECCGARAETAYCVLEPPEEGFIDSSRFGCHAVGGDGYALFDSALRRERTARALRRARFAGAKWARLHYLSWALREPERGRDAWDGLDERLDLAAQNGLRILVNVVGVPRWVSSSTDPKLTVTGEPRWKMAAPTDLDAWSNFVHRLVGRYRGRVADWEIGNEPGYTSAFWTTGSPADFAAYLKTANAAAHDADPSCRIYSGAPLDTHFLEEALAAAGGKPFFDVVSAHYLGNAKRFSTKAMGWNALNASLGLASPVVNSEDMDWHSIRGSGPLAVASAMVKLHVRDAAAGIARTFAFQPFIQGSEYAFHGAQGAPLPAFAAYRAMTHRLEHAEYVGDVSTAQCEAYVFNRGGMPVTVFWSAISVPATFRAAFGSGPFALVDFMDNESPAVPGADGLLAIPADGFPRYIEGGDWDSIRAAIKQCAEDRASAATTHPLGENLVSPDRRTLSANGRRFETILPSLPVRYGDTYLIAATIRGEGTLDGIVSIHDGDGNELWPKRQGLNCLRNRRATSEWSTVTDTFTVSDESAASLHLVLVADFWEKAAGAPIEVRDITVAQISEIHSASKALHRGSFGTDAFGPPITIDDASARLRLDEEGLHIRFEVADDAFDPPESPENCWFKDCIQFAIDPGDDGADFTSFRLLRTAGGRDILYKDRNYTTPELPDNITRHGVIDGARINFAQTSGGYSFDISIPVRELHPLKADARAIGFNFLVNDSDGGPREWREWTEGIGGLKTAAPFGHLGREEKQARQTPNQTKEHK